MTELLRGLGFETTGFSPAGRDQPPYSMTKGRFRHLPVEKDGLLYGIVSIGDVVKRRIEDVEREAEEIRAYIATA